MNCVFFLFIGEVSPILFNKPYLRRIAIDFNDLYGNLSEDICHQLPFLEEISFVHNRLEGNIRSLSNCTSLKSISLGENSFTGISLFSWASVSVCVCVILFFFYNLYDLIFLYVIDQNCIFNMLVTSN